MAESRARQPDRACPVVLIVCDGWGVAASDPAEIARRGDAVALARTPVRDRLLASCPWGLLATSGESVGLPAGQMGNSEVGHLNLGAGRIVHQVITRISMAIRDGSFFEIPALRELGAVLKRLGGALHLVGLCSDGGVHSDISHPWALLDWAERTSLPTRVHAFTDGRDTSPTSGIGWIEELEARAGASRGDIRIATVSGRYYAMDRDRRWPRTERAYRAIAEGGGPRVESASAYVAECYANATTDEFLPPAVVGAPDGIRPGDGVLFFNFRADRARQLTAALMDEAFPHFERPRGRCDRLVAMTRYEDDFPHPVLFPPRTLDNVLGAVLADAGGTQLRMAETEKYPHVTYFFNGGVEESFPGEERHLIPSPQVATYDLKPEMSAPELTEALVAHIAERRHDFILVNYANADMVGHTGSIPAAVAAVEAVDECVGRVLEAVARVGGTALVTADHGNAERMLCEDGSPFTAHTTGPVRLILSAPAGQTPATVRDGILADVAPTILHLLQIPQPREMTGTSLVS
ncbi:MAG: 2,3-bisphosphoglycerate-independent phosphoglycerate mutase [Gemmatimonadota bacterium]|nr:2,3-bisphosphoglycerate-independent phosphoglycerate mutase [Gemmatimonadota bacterium]MDE2866809.1 2,3-bisphosphoglycerate-independent phosphoglycerate mutase [Gemmatimonadota bacterium]